MPQRELVETSDEDSFLLVAQHVSALLNTEGQVRPGVLCCAGRSAALAFCPEHPGVVLGIPFWLA